MKAQETHKEHYYGKKFAEDPLTDDSTPPFDDYAEFLAVYSCVVV